MERGKWGADETSGLGEASIMRHSKRRGGSAGLFLEQSVGVLGGCGRWDWSVEMKVREKMLC